MCSYEYYYLGKLMSYYTIITLNKYTQTYLQNEDVNYKALFKEAELINYIFIIHYNPKILKFKMKNKERTQMSLYFNHDDQ